MVDADADTDADVDADADADADANTYFDDSNCLFWIFASPVSQPCHTCTPQGLSGSKGERGLLGVVQGTLGTGLQGPHSLRLGSPALPPVGDRPPAHQGLALQIVT